MKISIFYVVHSFHLKALFFEKNGIMLQVHITKTVAECR